MYEAFYGFSEKPFSLLPDPSFLYLGKKHSLAYSMLEYGLVTQAGFSVITGDVGSGKTTLIRHLLNQISDDISIGLLSNTHRNQDDLLQWVLLAFDQSYQAESKVALFDQFTRFLIDQYAQNRRTVLIIDEAQNLGPLQLEELRMLSNINADKDQVLQLILVGQPELRETLRRTELRQFSQRILVDYHLPALNRDETQAYIEHRIHCVGYRGGLFNEGAANLVFEASQGIPRIINTLCDTALVYGFADQKLHIDSELIRAVLRDKSEYGVIKVDSPADVQDRKRVETPMGEVMPLPPEDEREKVAKPFDESMARQLFSHLREK